MSQMDLAQQAAYQTAKQQAWLQAQNLLYQTTYSQGSQGLANAYAPKKEDPKNEFLEKVRKIYMKKLEIKIRFTMGVIGSGLFVFAPLIGYELYRLWRYSGMPDIPAQMSATAIGVGCLIAGTFGFVNAIQGDMAKSWARDWVLENEAK